jgi:hypothetical protein
MANAGQPFEMVPLFGEQCCNVVIISTATVRFQLNPPYLGSCPTSISTQLSLSKASVQMGVWRAPTLANVMASQT